MHHQAGVNFENLTAVKIRDIFFPGWDTGTVPARRMVGPTFTKI